MSSSPSSLSDVKALGGIGAILVLFTAVPTVGWALGIAGFVMILVAINRISRLVNDKSIFENMLTAIILAIGAVAVGTVTIVGTIYRVLGIGTFVGSKFVFPSSLPPSEFAGLALGVIAGLVVVWALLVASAVFVRKSLTTTSMKLNVGLFGTAGLLYLIGAATAIIAVGFILIFVADILLAVSFFSMKDELPRAPDSGRGQTVTATTS